MLFTVYGLPGASQSKMNEADHTLFDDRLAQEKTRSFAKHAVPKVTPFATAKEVSDEWKKAKAFGKDCVARTKGILGAAASTGAKPRPEDVLTSRGRLRDHHAKMQGWQIYFRTFRGRQLDPDGRRINSAIERDVMAKIWHDENHILLGQHDDDGHWQKIRDTVPERLRMIEQEEIRLANDRKRHRTKYSAFVEHLEQGGHRGDVAFVSSRRAKRMRAKVQEEEANKSSDPAKGKDLLH